jgi:hypothetical protein
MTTFSMKLPWKTSSPCLTLLQNSAGTTKSNYVVEGRLRMTAIVLRTALEKWNSEKRKGSSSVVVAELLHDATRLDGS